MPSPTCTSEHHVWHVVNDKDRLKTATLRHGHRCQCGKMVIAHIDCSEGCRHKRVITKAQFDHLMEER